jgi:hypothetical protein
MHQLRSAFVRGTTVGPSAPSGRQMCLKGEWPLKAFAVRGVPLLRVVFDFRRLHSHKRYQDAAVPCAARRARLPPRAEAAADSSIRKDRRHPYRHHQIRKLHDRSHAR